MTDEAITIAADAAPMPENNGASIGAGQEAVAEGFEALGKDITEKAERTAVAKAPTSREAIARAFEKMNKPDQVDDQTAGVDPAQSGRERNPDGTFKAIEKAVDAAAGAKVEVKPSTEALKPAAALGEAPSRFSADAKAAWATAPEAIKAETVRAIKELEGGIQQYQQAFQPYKDFDAQLKTNGQTFKEVFDHYTGIEAKLAENPLEGLDTICRNMGLSLEQVAKHVLGQPADEQAQQKDAYVAQLEQKVNALEKKVGGVTTTLQSQFEKSLMDTIDAFVAKPENARFEELSEDIAFFMKSGRAQDLQEAYDMAARLNPAPATVQAPQPAALAASQTAAPQTRKGQLSPSGAPAPGSDPVTRKPPSSAREAIERSFAQMGL